LKELKSDYETLTVGKHPLNNQWALHEKERKKGIKLKAKASSARQGNIIV